MNLCGYIHLYDTDSNRQDILKVCVYKCKNTEDISDDTPLGEYVFDKKTLSVLSENNDFSFVSYLMLREIASCGIKLDKAVEYPLCAKFNFDINDNPCVRYHNTIKEIFPVPFKSDMYMKHKLYFNITHKLWGKSYFDILTSDIITRLLNFAALRDGFSGDYMFASCCGRVFLNGDYFSSKAFRKGNIHRLFPECYEFFRKNNTQFPGKLSDRKRPVLPAEKIQIGSHPFVREYNKSAREIADFSDSVFHLLENAHVLLEYVQNLLSALDSVFDNLLWQGVVKSYESFEYVTYDDLLCLSLPDGRENFEYHLASNRKFFNCHKDTDIFCIDSDGVIYRKN